MKSVGLGKLAHAIVAPLAMLAMFGCSPSLDRRLDRIDEEIERIAFMDMDRPGDTPFEPEIGAGLTRFQVSRVSQIYEDMAECGATPAELILKVGRIASANIGSRNNPLGEEVVQEILDNLLPQLERCKRAQIGARSRSGLSAAEYRWVQERILASIGRVVHPVDTTGLREYVRWRAEQPDDYTVWAGGSLLRIPVDEASEIRREDRELVDEIDRDLWRHTRFLTAFGI